MSRVRLALDGLSVGDAFGQQFFTIHAPMLLERRAIPAPPWEYTDDTEMSLGIAEVLASHGRIHRKELARVFGRRYAAEPGRGYGAAARHILDMFSLGAEWRPVSQGAFDGMGSCGNGGAMRAAPVGAYFADDFERTVIEAGKSAEVTHAHPEGQAGAIAIAVAAAWAVRRRVSNGSEAASELFEVVLAHTPRGETRRGIEHARELDRALSVQTAVSALGNGSQVISQDTVPFCLWCIARHLDEYEEAMWETVSGLGDRDTTCAIVGGVIALACGPGCIPADWLSAREPLDYHGR